MKSARTPLVSGPEEQEGTVPGRASTPPTAPRRPCFSHVSIIAVGRRPFLSSRVLHLRHPCLFDESCDLFPTSGVELCYVRAMVECQNVVLLVSVDSVNGFIQRAQLWSETGSDGRWQGQSRRARHGCLRRGGPDTVGSILLRHDTLFIISVLESRFLDEYQEHAEVPVCLWHFKTGKNIKN